MAVGSFFKLKLLQTSASDLAWPGVPWASLAQQLAHQITVKWPMVETLSICSQSSPAVGTAIIAQLTKGTWLSLVRSKHGLSAEDFVLLRQGNCPALTA